MDSAVNGNTSSINTLDSRLTVVENNSAVYVGDNNISVNPNEYIISLNNTLSGLQIVQSEELRGGDTKSTNYITIGATDLTFYEDGLFVDKYDNDTLQSMKYVVNNYDNIITRLNMANNSIVTMTNDISALSSYSGLIEYNMNIKNTEFNTRLTITENNLHNQYMNFDERILILDNKTKWLEAGDNIEVDKGETTNTVRLKNDLTNLNTIEVMTVDMNNINSVINLKTLNSIFSENLWPDIDHVLH